MNIVEIVVRATDDTKAGFAAASASADSMSAKLSKIGMIGGAALGAVAVASVDMASKFDSSMQLLNTQAGVAQNKIAGLSQGVLALAGKVGFSPDSLAQALFHIESSFASTGITGSKALELLKIAAEGAAVGHANLVDTTNALDATIASGVGGIKNFSQAMGALNAIVGSGDMHMQDLNEAMGTGIMSIAKSYGQSIIQVGAALATLGDNNIRGAKAATDLRMAWQAIQSPLKAGVGVLQDLGINSKQLADVMTHKGLTAALQELQDHLIASKIPISDWGQYVTEIFGKKAGVGIAVLLDQLDRVKSKIPDITKAMGGFGSAWAATQQQATQQFNELKGSVEALAIQLGNKLLPYAQSLMNFLLSHQAVALDFAKAIGAVTIALTAFSLAMKIAALITNPWALIAVAVVALAVLIIKYHTDIWNFIKKTWDDIVSYLKGVATDIEAPVKAMWAQIESWWKSYGGEIEQLWHEFWTVITDAAKAFWAFFGPYIKTQWDIATTVFKVALTAIETVFKVAWTAITAAVKIVWAGLEAYFKTAFDVIVGIFQVALDLLTGHWSKAWTDFKNIGIQIWNNITGFLKTWLNTVVSSVKNVGTDLLNAGRAIFGDLWQGLKDVGQNILDWVGHWVSSLPSTILKFLHMSPPHPGSAFYDIGSNMMTHLGAGIKAAAAAAEQEAQAAVNKAAKAAGVAVASAPGSVSGNAALMKNMAASRGWTGNQWNALYDVEMREAGFSMTATNPSSGAYGMAQFINGPSEYAQYGGNANTAAGQITGMLNYIAQRYGNPAGAWAHEQAYGWYDQGGWLPPGRSVAVNNTGRPELVVGPNGLNVQLEVVGGDSEFQQFMSTFIKNYVRIKGGGNVQKAFGRT